MKLKFVLLGASLFFLILLLVGWTIVGHTVPQETAITRYDFFVVPDKNGFNADKDKLHFGIVNPGDVATRSFTISNKEDYQKKIYFYFAANVSTNISQAEWFYIKEADHLEHGNPFFVEPRSEKTFKIFLHVPQNATIGFYDGTMIATMYKAWFWEK